MPKHSPVQFHFLAPCPLKARTRLKAWINSLFRKHGRKLDSLQVIFCSDAYLLDLNRQFLKHDYYTDILSFPLSDPGMPLSAEIYISVDRVKDNAGNLGCPFRQEIHRVIFHGALHFLGFRDKTLKDQKKMREMEEKCLRLYFKTVRQA